MSRPTDNTVVCNSCGNTFTGLSTTGGVFHLPNCNHHDDVTDND